MKRKKKYSLNSKFSEVSALKQLGGDQQAIPTGTDIMEQ